MSEIIEYLLYVNNSTAPSIKQFEDVPKYDFISIFL